MATKYGTQVVKRERIDLTDRRYHRKVWDNGYVDTYVVFGQRSTNRREVIPDWRWDDLAKEHPVIEDEE